MLRCMIDCVHDAHIRYIKTLNLRSDRYRPSVRRGLEACAAVAQSPARRFSEFYAPASRIRGFEDFRLAEFNPPS